MRVPCVISKILLFCPVSDSCVTNPLFTCDFPMGKITKIDKYAAIRGHRFCVAYPTLSEAIFNILYADA